MQGVGGKSCPIKDTLWLSYEKLDKVEQHLALQAWTEMKTNLHPILQFPQGHPFSIPLFLIHSVSSSVPLQYSYAAD